MASASRSTGPRVPRCYVTEGVIREVRWLGRQEASDAGSVEIVAGGRREAGGR